MENPEQFPKVCMYHPKLAPGGRDFDSKAEMKRLGRKWVDSPAKFPKPSRIAQMLRSMEPWWTEWKWLFQAIGAAVVLAGAISGVVLRFWR